MVFDDSSPANQDNHVVHKSFDILTRSGYRRNPPAEITSMRIAQVAPLNERVPPALDGGTEGVVSFLTAALVRLGHDVTLFASGDSETSARLVPACPRALWRDPNVLETLPHHVRLMELVFKDVSRFDVIHFHADYLHFPLVRRHRCASVTTCTGWSIRTT
jgi:hypothetical protein